MTQIQTRGWHPKIDAMLRGMEFRQGIRDEQDERARRRIDNKDHFCAALSALKSADPAWEAWYDDNQNIPEIIDWSNAFPVIVKIEQRIQEITGSAFIWMRRKEPSFVYYITRPRKSGKGNRVFVKTLYWFTKTEFAEWWRRNAQRGWTAQVLYSNIKRIQK